MTGCQCVSLHARLFGEMGAGAYPLSEGGGGHGWDLDANFGHAFIIRMHEVVHVVPYLGN